ncbi:MAG TPA: DUF3224 domain-containing protein [Micromonosporaceae bacterium]|jgi:hypothetical protein|nr:DUF3224 domain-containing protein [Micromonosporaceae bacterium]
MTEHIDGTFEITSWDEKPYLELAGERKFTRAAITQRIAGAGARQVGPAGAGIEGEMTSESLMFYPGDGSATYTGYGNVTGRIGRREGTFVVQIGGEFDGTVARSVFTVVAGSGTGDLAGLRGEFTSDSTQADYPSPRYAFAYDIE